jgi:hypothetical protein
MWLGLGKPASSTYRKSLYNSLPSHPKYDCDEGIVSVHRQKHAVEWGYAAEWGEGGGGRGYKSVFFRRFCFAFRQLLIFHNQLKTFVIKFETRIERRFKEERCDQYTVWIRQSQDGGVRPGV